jgi:ribosomal protein S18 acetylase RimI-like enzyme
MTSLTDDIEPHRAAFLELEYSASSAYNEFVYSTRAQADAIRRLLLDKGVAEYGWRYSRALIEDGNLAGFITRLSMEQLVECRMKSAFAIGKSGFFEEDPKLFDRMNVAAGILASVGKGDFYISRLAVGETFAGRGYAGLLMRHAQEEAVRSGARRLTFEVASDNLPVYNMHRKQGFEEVERRDAQDAATGRSLTFIQMARLL